MHALLLAALLGQCAGGACPTQYTVPAAYQLQDQSGQVWMSPDLNHLRAYVASRNAAMSPPPLTREEVKAIVRETCSCSKVVNTPPAVSFRFR